MITICYVTNRRNPRFSWFFDSLYREWEGAGFPQIGIVVVDFYAQEPDRSGWVVAFANRFFREDREEFRLVHTAPHGNVWQGHHRLTQRDYFAASVARNTGLMHAEDGYIVYVDDLSVLLPGWFEQVKQAANEGWVACGAYAKVPKLEVEDGVMKGFAGLPLSYSAPQNICTIAQDAHPSGFDNRWKHTPHGDFNPYPCGGNWLFGASCAMPVEALLQIGGWDWRANTAGGGEDYLCGLMLEKHGYQLKYCKRMMTLESEEAHGEEPPFARIIKGDGHGPNEKNNASWRLLNMVLGDAKPTVPDNFGNGGIRGLRERTLNGEPFPVFQNPEHDWYDGQPLREM